MLSLILTLALIGFIAYLIVTYIPMADIIKKVILVIIAVCMILFIMRALGIGDIPIPQIH